MVFCARETWAVEGSTVAGPIGGSDVRAAQLPPSGLYGFGVAGFGRSFNFNDGQGRAVPAFAGLDQTRTNGGLGFLYVPEHQIFGGALGLVGFFSAGHTCGRLFKATNRQCFSGLGDPYLEVNWSRHFGTIRQSRYSGAYPIAEGLSFQVGLGAVVPVGHYSASDARTHGITVGNNYWDIAPMAAFTYTTPPIFADATEFSAKAYLNRYLENPATNYQSGSLLNVDFAVTERIGRFQAGLAGLYAEQLTDDRQFGAVIPPDGRQANVLGLGLVGVYDLPEHASAIKLKALGTVAGENVVDGFGISLTFFKKLY